MAGAAVRFHLDVASGWAQLRFPYNLELIALVKQHPGATWDKAQKCWFLPADALPIFNEALASRGDSLLQLMRAERRFPLPVALASRLRPYQQAGADFLVQHVGALLTMEMRTGKTPTAITAACALLERHPGAALLVIYPNAVRWEWKRQLARWAGLRLETLSTLDRISVEEGQRLNAKPYLALGCHYEILEAQHGEHNKDCVVLLGGSADCIPGSECSSITRALRGRPYILIADEVHFAKNRKIGRTKLLWDLAHDPMCLARWGLTGTPMRNRPRDLWALFEFVGSKRGGTYWQFAKRFCDAKQDDLGHWDDSGTSNEEELARRLAGISFRVTRAEVAPHLPKADVRVTLCSMTKAERRRYDALEQASAGLIRAALDAEGDGLRNAQARLEALVALTSSAKYPVAIERARFHTEERAVKVLVFAHFHSTLDALDRAFDASGSQRHGVVPAPHFVAGGWMTADKRKNAIEAWRACPGPAVLLANTISSGVGIDLADADTALFLELEWVPADLAQAMARIQDVHQGKRTTPPLYEFLLVSKTLDESMALKQLSKLRAINSVVGTDEDINAVAAGLRASGVTDSTRLGLVSTDDASVAAAMESLREALLAAPEEMSDPDDTVDPEALGEAFSDEDSEEADADAAIPF